MRSLMFIVTVSIASSASAMSWDFAPKQSTGVLPSAAAAGELPISSPAALLSLPSQEAPQATDGLLAMVDDCADGSCSVVRGQPVRNVVRAVADRPRRLFARRPVRSFLGRFRLFGGCRGCN